MHACMTKHIKDFSWHPLTNLHNKELQSICTFLEAWSILLKNIQSKASGLISTLSQISETLCNCFCFKAKNNKNGIISLFMNISAIYSILFFSNASSSNNEKYYEQWHFHKQLSLWAPLASLLSFAATAKQLCKQFLTVFLSSESLCQHIYLCSSVKLLSLQGIYSIFPFTSNQVSDAIACMLPHLHLRAQQGGRCQNSYHNSAGPFAYRRELHSKLQP